MSITSTLKSEAGFTIQELLVAIVAGSLLVGFSFALYLFVSKLVQKDLQARMHRDATLTTIELIASDVERASSIELLTDSTLELASATQERIFYIMRQGVLFRGTMALGPPPGERWLVQYRLFAGGTLKLKLKSSWGKDSLEACTKVQVPMSSTLKFSAKNAADSKSPSARIVQE